MQGILFFVVALFALTHAQAQGKGTGADAGGCCFYSDKEYKNVVVCTSEEFNIPARAAIQSFFCTEQFSAAIVDGDAIQELAGCGDALDASLLPIPATRIAVGPCSPQRRCCLYTGVNKDGDEFCLNDPAASAEELRAAQANSKFRVAECTANYRATLVEKGGKSTQVGCGVTFDIPANTELTAITMTPCANPAMGSEDDITSDFVDQALSDEDFAALDQAVSDQFDAQFDAQFDNTFDAQFDNTFDAQYDAAAADNFADNFAADTAMNNEEGFVDQAFSSDEDTFAMNDAGEEGFVDQAVGDHFDAQFDAQFEQPL